MPGHSFQSGLLRWPDGLSADWVNGCCFDFVRCSVRGGVFDQLVLLVVPRGDVPVVAAGAFPIADVKAVIELRDEV